MKILLSFTLLLLSFGLIGQEVVFPYGVTRDVDTVTRLLYGNKTGSMVRYGFRVDTDTSFIEKTLDSINFIAPGIYHNGVPIGAGTGVQEINDLTDGKSNKSTSVFLGQYSGTNYSSGYNTGVGIRALQDNVTGTNSTAIGFGALKASTSNSNTAVGTYALYTETLGWGNTAIGETSLVYQNRGYRNTAVGAGSGSLNSVDDCVYLGYQAGYSNANDNQLFIENSLSTTPLIGGDFSTDEVEINGTLLVVDDPAGTGMLIAGNGIEYESYNFARVTVPGIPSLPIQLTIGEDIPFTFLTGSDSISIDLTTAEIAANGELSALNKGYLEETLLNYYTSISIDTLTDGFNDEYSIYLGWNGGQYDAGSNENVGLGNSAFSAVTDGFSNVGIGHKCLQDLTEGNSNTAVGYRAMGDNTTGDYNTAIGFQALKNPNTSDRNTAIGYQSAYFLETGNQNNSFGYWSMYQTTTGSFNTAIGNSALRDNTTGSSNIAIGNQALERSEIGSSNIAIGQGAGLNHSVGVLDSTSNSIYIGDGTKALTDDTDNEIVIGDTVTGHGENTVTIGNTETTDAYIRGDLHLDGIVQNGVVVSIDSLTDGINQNNSLYLGSSSGISDDLTTNNNTAIGNQAMRNTTTGSSNTAVGYYTMWTNISGNYNSAFGTYSLDASTTGINNTAIGYGAISTSTTGNYNTAVGSYSLVLATGSSNTAVGFESGYNTTGNNNTAIGFRALRNNNAGNSNTAVGYQAGYGVLAQHDKSNGVYVGYQAGYNDTTGDNTFVGHRSGYKNTSGIGNAALGIGSMQNNTTGGYNMAFGRYTLYGNLTGVGNAGLGNATLYNNTSGSFNVAIGNGVSYQNTTGSFNVAIGNGVSYQNTTGSYNVSIGGSSNYYNQTGSENTILGHDAGKGTSLHNKSGNVFIGYKAGFNETGSNKLYIDNSNTKTPLIYGDFSTDELTVNGTLTTNNSFGELVDPSTVISTATTGKYYTLSGWSAGEFESATLDTDSTILVEQAGTYLLSFSMSFTHATNNTIVHICAFNSTDNSEFTNVETERKISTGGDFGNVGGVGLVVLDANDKVCIRAKADKTGNLTVNHGNFNLVRIK